jgi:hypothetical protein
VGNAATQALAITSADANLGTATTNITTLFSNAITQATALNSLNANLGTATTNITTLFSNAATQALSITSADANLGTATTNITTLFSNAATQSASINTTNANITAANAAILTLQTQVYTDSNVAAYLPVYTGNVGAGNITASNLYGNLQSPYQDGIVSVGTLDNLTVAGDTVINGNLSLINNQILANDVYISGNLNLNNNTTIISTEEINSTVRHLILVHDVTNPVDALGAGLMTPFSAWTYNNTFNSWQSNVNLLPSASNTYDIGSDSGITWRSGHFGNIYGNIATPNQAQITSVGNLSALSVSGNSIFYGSVITSNLRPRSNAVYSLGTVDHQWKDLWVSGNTIYIGNAPISIDGGTLLVNGAPVSGSYGNANVEAYIGANIGAFQTYSNANVAGLQTSINSLVTTANANTAAYLTAGISTNITTTGNVTVSGNIIQQGAYYETYGNISNSGGNLTCNFNLGSTFYATLGANVTANFTNVTAVSSTVTGATIIVDQGATAYRIANVQVNGVNQTIRWVGATAGTGTASNTDVMSFSLIHLGGGAYRVLGQISNYG